MATPDINPGASDSLDLAPVSLAQKDGKTMFLAHMMYKLNKMDNIISTMGGADDIRIEHMTRQIIVAVMDDQVRNNLLSTLGKNLATLAKAPMESAERANLRIVTCQAALGEVYSYLDAAFNISTFDTISPLVTYPEPEPEEDKQDDK